MRNAVTASEPIPRKSHLGMPYALSNFADVKFYGPGFPDSPTLDALRGGARIDVLKVVNKLYGNDYPDVVIQFNPFNDVHIGNRYAEGLWSVLDNFHLVKCLRVMWILDLHNTVGMTDVLEYIEQGKIDIVIKYNDADNISVWSKKLVKTGVTLLWCPFSVNAHVFFDKKMPKKYDVSTIGTKNQVYPLRLKIRKVLQKHKDVKTYDGGAVWEQEYAEVINETKIFATGCASYMRPLQKMFEVMACNTLLLCNIPMDAERLGFQPNVNFASIDYNPSLMYGHGGWTITKQPTDDMVWQPLQYWLNHPKHAQQVAQKGHDLIHSKHTHEIRTKQLVEQLAKYVV